MSPRSARSAVETCLAQIARHEGQLRAWVTVDRDGARQAADALDAQAQEGARPGPLYGMVVGVKDIFDVAGMPTTSGASSFAHRLPERDAPAVGRLRAAGTVILGKTVTTEFAFADPSVTRNPWNAEHTPGGSSSGSAAAVAARMADAALGSQTIGSTIRPAAYCGIVGFKGTYGRIPTAGVTPLAWSLDHVGIFARSVDDVIRLFAAVADQPATPSATGRGIPSPEGVFVTLPGFHNSPRGELRREPQPLEAGPAPATAPAAAQAGPAVPARPPRFAVPRGWIRGIATSEVQAHLDEVVAVLCSAGASVTDVELPPSAARIEADGRLVLRVEAAAYHSRWFAEHASEYGRRIRELVESGLDVPATDYVRAQDTRRAFRREMADIFADCDALLLPAAPSTAPALAEDTTGDPVFCAPWTFAGLPAVTLPSGLSSRGLPLAAQLVGSVDADARLLEIARWCEAQIGFGAAPPL